MQGSQCVCIVRQQGGEQAAPVHLQLEQFVHIQRSRVAHHIAHKALTQCVAAQLGQWGQGAGFHIQIGAPRISVDGFEGVGDGLDLFHALGSAGQPHIMGERGNHLIALGIVRLELVELGLQSFLQEGADGRSVACLATCFRGFRHGNTFPKGLEAKIPRSAQNQPGMWKRLGSRQNPPEGVKAIHCDLTFLLVPRSTLLI